MTAQQSIAQGSARFHLSEEMGEKIEALKLGETLEDFARDGYAIVRDIASEEITDRIRAAILQRAKKGGPANMSSTVQMLLGTDPVFEEAALNPRVLAIVEAVCGKGAMLSQLLGSVREQGPDHVPLHADQSWWPAPFPEHTQMITLCWTCDEYTQEAGSTAVVPGSHALRRSPTTDEAAEPVGLVPTVCPRNSIVGWLGETWHSSYPRAVAGQRVVLHMTFSRITIRPVENYSHLDEAWLDGKPEALRVLLGREDFLDKSDLKRNDGNYMKLVRKTQSWGRDDTFRVKF